MISATTNIVSATEYLANMNAAILQTELELAKFGEVFVRFDTAPLLRDPELEFLEDIVEMQRAEELSR